MMLRSFTCAGTALLAVFACSNAFDGCVCTQEFRVYGLSVVDTAGAPVDGVALEIRQLRTGRVLTPTFLGLATPGTYWIADDSMGEEFRPQGDDVRVSGTEASRAFSADFVFAVDECGCHVQKLAGPDTVVIR